MAVHSGRALHWHRILRGKRGISLALRLLPVGKESFITFGEIGENCVLGSLNRTKKQLSFRKVFSPKGLKGHLPRGAVTDIKFDPTPGGCPGQISGASFGCEPGVSYTGVHTWGHHSTHTP